MENKSMRGSNELAKKIKRAKGHLNMERSEIEELLGFAGILCFKYNLKEHYCPEYDNFEKVMHYTAETYWKTLIRQKERMKEKPGYVGNLYYFTHPNDISRIDNATNKLISTGEIQTELRFLCGDGEYHWFEVKMYVSKNDSNIINGYIYNIDDKIEELNSLKTTLESEMDDKNQLYDILDFAGILHFEYIIAEKRYGRFSNLEKVMKYTVESYKEKLAELIDLDDEYGEILGNMYYFVHDDDKKKVWRSAENLRHSGEIKTEIRFLCGDGKYHWFKIDMNVIKNGTVIIGYMCNVDSKIKEIQALEKLSVTDPMTGLLNKVASFNKINTYLLESPKESSAMIVLDIDDFKKINDGFGHRVGDEVIIYISDTMRSFFKTGEIISRFGGDEFVVFVKDIVDKEELRKKVSEFLSECKECPYPENYDYNISLSAGIFLSENNITVEEIFIKADEMLYKAKNTGKGKMVCNF